MADQNSQDFISKFRDKQAIHETDRRQVAYYGKIRPLLKLGLITGLLTLFTLGIYRFWARTRVRRYFWSSVAPNGQPFEYTGNGLEKLLGFLIAVAVLAVYLGIIQVLLTFFGYSLFTQAETVAGEAVQVLVLYGVGLAILPLVYYAQYRGRRYLLSRTRWSGVRFGAEKAAWGYVWAAIKNNFLTLVTLGILLPRQTFNLEKFRMDRTWFGNAKFTQNGDWKMLIPAAKHYYIGLALFLLGAVFYGYSIFAAVSNGSEGAVENLGFLLIGGTVFTAGYVWIAVGLAIYNVASWRTMANNKSLGNGIRFRSEVDTAEVVLAYILGSILASIIALIIALVLAFAIGIGAEVIFSSPALDEFEFGVGAIVGFAVGYLSFLIFFGAIALVSIRQPVLRAMASTVTILNANEIDTILQREDDDFVEAEGFADALDVGAGF